MLTGQSIRILEIRPCKAERNQRCANGDCRVTWSSPDACRAEGRPQRSDVLDSLELSWGRKGDSRVQESTCWSISAMAVLLATDACRIVYTIQMRAHARGSGAAACRPDGVVIERR